MTTTANRRSVRSFDRLMIGGQWVEPSSEKAIEVVSPITEEVVAAVPDAQEADVDAAVTAARRAFDDGQWPRMSLEELGPMLTMIPFATPDDAVQIANDSPYGLSGAVFANDVKLAENIARRVRTGQISVTSRAICNIQPFGGFKQSGIGREGGIEGIEPYLETKVIQGLDAAPIVPNLG